MRHGIRRLPPYTVHVAGKTVSVSLLQCRFLRSLQTLCLLAVMSRQGTDMAGLL